MDGATAEAIRCGDMNKRFVAGPLWRARAVGRPWWEGGRSNDTWHGTSAGANLQPALQLVARGMHEH
eukprot:11110270-Alexandrium_andersonii.AAC.1